MLNPPQRMMHSIETVWDDKGVQNLTIKKVFGSETNNDMSLVFIVS